MTEDEVRAQLITMGGVIDDNTSMVDFRNGNRLYAYVAIKPVGYSLNALGYSKDFFYWEVTDMLMILSAFIAEHSDDT